jgi:hypothetical protein
MTPRHLVALALVPMLLVGVTLTARQAPRRVAWVVGATDRAAERAINEHAARGLRVAAAADGLQCPVVVMQSPGGATTAPADYRIVADRDLAAALPGLADDGYEPRTMMRRIGTRADVVWERADRPGEARTSAWRLTEFANPDTLDADLAAVARDGFRPRLLARGYLRSWPGLSEKGLILSGQRAGASAREVRVLRGTRRDVDALASELAELGSQGWEFDLAFTSSRDGSRDARRERVFVVLSREAGRADAPAAPLRLVRTSSWGMVGEGRLLFAGVYWNDFLFILQPEDRSQIWASPLRLSANEANCIGLSLKLRFDGQREQRSTITSALARPIAGSEDVELIVTVADRLGGR